MKHGVRGAWYVVRASLRLAVLRGAWCVVGPRKDPGHAISAAHDSRFPEPTTHHALLTTASQRRAHG